MESWHLALYARQLLHSPLHLNVAPQAPLPSQPAVAVICLNPLCRGGAFSFSFGLVQFGVGSQAQLPSSVRPTPPDPSFKGAGTRDQGRSPQLRADNGLRQITATAGWRRFRPTSAPSSCFRCAFAPPCPYLCMHVGVQGNETDVLVPPARPDLPRRPLGGWDRQPLCLAGLGLRA